MKRKYVVVAAIALLVVLFPLSTGVHAMVYRYKLIAGQNLEVGLVEVWNTEDNLYVHYRVWSMSYCLLQTHVHVADTADDVPHNKGGPIPGQFTYGTDHDCIAEFEYEIPLDGWQIGDRVIILAHAVVGDPSNPEWQETAWGIQCGDFDRWGWPGRKWAAYMEYPIH